MKKLLLVCTVLCICFVSNAQRFQGQFNVGTIFADGGAGPTVDLTAGVLLFNHFYAGIETGYDSLFSNVTMYDGYYMYKVTSYEGYIPLGINMKGYFTEGTSLKPYLNCSLGGFFGVADLNGINGFRCQLGAGIDYRRFNFGIGYNLLYKWGAFHSGYIKLGFRF